jgi:phage tail sheath protein FI
MPTYLAPGIYIEEVSSGVKPIEKVGTSTAAFIGVAPNPEAHVHDPIGINNWSEFVAKFSSTGATSTPLAQAVYGFFENGGGRCYVVNVGPRKELIGEPGKRQGVEALEEIDEVAIVAAPGYTDLASYETLLSHCEKLGDRVCILDAPENGADFKIGDLTKAATSGTAKQPKKPAAGEPAAGEPPAASGGGGLKPRQSFFGAFYFPYLVVRDPFSPKDLVNVPPSGHLAGIYARNDGTRGVHKAPANEPVRGALDLTYKVTREEQGELNKQGVNCIRLFATQGIRVWGARTLADSASEWRYLNVRRLFNQIEESIAEGTRWVVFEPNDISLWKSIRRDVSAFLMGLWREGALMGATPEEAFFVKCDAETNPPDEVDRGNVITVVGIAPVKPAEFVIFRIGQGAGGTDIEVQGGA